MHNETTKRRSLTADDIQFLHYEIDAIKLNVAKRVRIYSVGRWVLLIPAVLCLMFFGPVLFLEQPLFGLGGVLNQSEILIFRFSLLLAISVYAFMFLVIEPSSDLRAYKEQLAAFTEFSRGYVALIDRVRVLEESIAATCERE